MTTEEWGDGLAKCFGMLMDGRAQSSGIQKRGLDATMLIVMNSWQDAVLFTLPEAPEGDGWYLLIDTNIPDNKTDEMFDVGHTYEVTSRSLLLFLMQRKDVATDATTAAKAADPKSAVPAAAPATPAAEPPPVPAAKPAPKTPDAPAKK
jgi:glycogen operon protein